MSGSDSHAACLLSVIVPVYGVERYLRECLDSILGQADDRVELVAVNDASPDGSGEILAEYAARDARVQVLTHPTNLGVAVARNDGLAQARGEYVWFVDPDDWLTPGAIDTVVDRIVRTRPDVLVIGYERSYWDGRRHPERLVAPGPALPEVFTAHEQPRILTTLTLACNKVIRREYLDGLGLRWGSGWYEDVAYTKPLLLAAERIGVIERVCYGYRQRPEGATTSTTSRRHTEAFQQWQHVFDFADRPEYDDLRPIVFQRMIMHYLGILNHPSRIARADRRAFFDRIVSDYRRLRPSAGYPRPGGVANLTFALVAINAFGLFEVLRAIYRTRTGLRRSVAAVGRAVRRAYYWAQRRLALREESVVYAAGTYDGYPASPYAHPVAEVMARARPLTVGTPTVVVVGDRRTADASRHRLGSWAALRAFGRARLLIVDGELPTSVIVRPGQRLMTLPAELGQPTPPAAPDQSTLPAAPDQSTLPAAPDQSTLPAAPDQSTLTPDQTTLTAEPDVPGPRVSAATASPNTDHAG